MSLVQHAYVHMHMCVRAQTANMNTQACDVLGTVAHTCTDGKHEYTSMRCARYSCAHVHNLCALADMMCWSACCADVSGSIALLGLLSIYMSSTELLVLVRCAS